jgi:hypothetical protein
MENIERKLYVGIVENISDPNKKGKIQVRVQGVFEELETENIPWASPYKSLAGKAFELPGIGKIVNVIFPNGDLHDPYYIYSENYNINLKNVLEDYSIDKYETFVALLFDHRTQIYSDEDEMVFDYKYNKITIDNDSINLQLKDNNGILNIGTKDAKQQAMLGNNFLDWFNSFIRALQNDPAMLGNGMILAPPAPILKPDISLGVCRDFWQKRETFLSDHVYVTDNKKINKLE